jgi:hypothetical protein
MPLDFGLLTSSNIPGETRNILEMYRQGMATQEAQNQSLLRKQIGSTMASEGPLAAADVAYAGGDVQTGIDLQKMPIERLANLTDWMGRGALAANGDQATWDRFISSMRPIFGDKELAPYKDVSTANDFITQSMSMKDQIDLKMKERELAIQEQKLHLPDLSMTEIYDESGRPQKGTFDKNTGKFTPIGKPKAQTGSISFTTAAGDTIEIGGDGGSTGPGGNAQLNKTASNIVQTKAINAAEMGACTKQIMADFKPEYQTIGERLKQKGMTWAAALDPKLLSSDQQRDIIGFAQFKTTAIGNLNRILNELSGQAVTATEMGRIATEMPNPGTGVFDGDDPITFKAKADTVTRNVDKALARYRYYQAVGIPNRLDEIPLSDVRPIDGEWFVKARDGSWNKVDSAGGG